MTVFAVQQQRVRQGGQLVDKFDFTDAQARYGEVNIILDHSATPFDMAPVITRLHEHLKNITNEDWIILTGNPVLIGLAVAIAADYLDGCLRILQWSGSTDNYIPITLENVYDN